MTIKKYAEKIKSFLDKHSKLTDVLLFFVMIYLSAETVRNVVYCAESEFQIHRDIFTFKSALFFLILVLILRKANLFRLPYLFAIPAYGIYYYRNMSIYTPEDYGVDLSSWHSVLLIANGIFLITFIDTYLRFKDKEKRTKLDWYGIATFSVGAVLLGINYNYSRLFLFPLLALFTTEMTKKTWRKFVDAFSIGYYLAFLYVFTNSYMVDRTLFKGHYYGTFLNVATGSAFCVGAFVCAIYGILRAKELRCRILTVVSCILIPYPLFAIVLFNERSGYLAVFMVIAFLAIFFRFDSGKVAGWKKRAVISASVLLVIATVSVIGLILFTKANTGALKEFLRENVSEYLVDTVDMYTRRAESLLYKGSYLHIIPENSWLNPIDNLSSWRISYWINSFERTTLWGDGLLYVGNDYFESTNPHSTFVSAYRMYGYVGGTIFFIWAIFTFVYVTRKVLKGNTDLSFTFLWTVFFMTYSLVETALWSYIMGFTFLVVLYPLGKKFKAEENEELALEE
ncbi:MAG: hypothetical protein MJ107_00530 [Lachnospiraceae bacterium]|nr:hypothetical protein [Lachnospiraceae bacterium]